MQYNNILLQYKVVLYFECRAILVSDGLNMKKPQKM